MMRKLFVSACFALALLVSGAASPTARADHGYGGRGYGGGYGAGYRAPSCHGGHQHGGYGGYGAGYVTQYRTVVPVYPGGIYQSYSFGGSPFGGYSNYGQIGSPFGAGYGVGYGSYRNSAPRVQLRIGF
jgi:hypothetical protein